MTHDPAPSDPALPHAVERREQFVRPLNRRYGRLLRPIKKLISNRHDDDVSTWRTTLGKVLVAPKTDFQVILLKRFQAIRNWGQIEIPNTHRFVDEVRFSSFSDPRQTPQSS